MFPPSAATAGFTYSSRILMICCEVHLDCQTPVF
jgi:hypothetical protein